MAGRSDPRPTIWVVAGPNGAGKSSVVGEMIRQSGGSYYNPDEYARTLRGRLSVEQANEVAWKDGKGLLEEAIEKGRNFAFETTLGGRTIPDLLASAARGGHLVRMWFVALASPELHLTRIRTRVSEGGHDIPEELVRQRYDRSRENLVRLLPRLDRLRVYDNSVEAGRTGRPAPRLVLDLRAGRVLNRDDLPNTPQWARPIVAAALLVEKRSTRKRAGRGSAPTGFAEVPRAGAFAVDRAGPGHRRPGPARAS